MKKRLIWAEVVAAGPNVRTMEPGDQVLFSPEDRYEVEVRGDDYIILRERDIHAVAASQGLGDFVEDRRHDPFDIPLIEMRIPGRQAGNQLRLGHCRDNRAKNRAVQA